MRKPSYVNVRKDILDLVQGNNLKVLDFGCSDGSNGAYLLGENIAQIVHGFEFDEAMCDSANDKLTWAKNVDLNNAVIRELTRENYDYLLFLDVLEHLLDPWAVLKQAADVLKPDGHVIISLPNANHISVFYHLFVNRRFPYNSRGIFDKTHFRWFTKSNIIELLDTADLGLVEVENKYRFQDKVGSKFPLILKPLKYIFKEFFTHQYIVVAKKKNR